jgi:hypothetical protein
MKSKKSRLQRFRESQNKPIEVQEEKISPLKQKKEPKKEASSTKKETWDTEINLDPWQQEVINYNGNIALRAGRQVGKSTAVGKKAAKFALENKDTTILMIGAAQRQSFLLFEKAKAEIDVENEKIIKQAGGYKYNPRLSNTRNTELERKFRNEKGIYERIPTKTEIQLKNGSRIYSLPAGKTGHTIRGLAIDLLIADEAAYIPEDVWLAVRPMIAVSRQQKGLGHIVLLSTPFGKGGYFYNCCNDPDFKQIHISSESCPRIPKDFLRKERARLTRLEYAQEYLGEFVDEFQQFFPSELIKKCMTFAEWDFSTDYKKELKYFLGVDLARYGEDENAFIVAEMQPDNTIKIVNVETTQRVNLVRTLNHILAKHNKYNFNKILIDDAGLGAGVTDTLTEKLGRAKVVGLNNSSRTIEEGKKKGIFKEDLYSNASVLMESGKLEMINSIMLARSLKSMTFEYTSDKNVLIKGKYSHLSEAFVRACWAVKTKHLKLFVY